MFVAWRSEPSMARAGPAEVSESVRTLDLGGALQAVSFALAPPFEIPPPPEPADLTDEPLIDLPEIAGTLTSTLEAPGLRRAGASGSAVPGPGLGGTGPRTTSPVPRSLIPEWDPPAEVRGTRVTARVRVSADGRPVGDVQLLPPTPNREFNRALVEKVLRMEYIPAQRNGRPVEAWAEITFVF
jgi:TonB family protein